MAKSFGDPPAGAKISSPSHWNHWRGPNGNSVAFDANPPVRFSDVESVRWKTTLVGRGSGSPVVWNDQVFITTEVPHPSGAGKLDFVVQSFDRDTGRTRWQTTVATAVPHEPTHSTNTFASASPCTDGNMVYAFFGSRGLHALDMNGKVQWSRDFGRMTMRNGFGEGASPTLTDQYVVVPWDHEGPSKLFVLDKSTGETVWQVDRDEVSNWGTPLVISPGGRDTASSVEGSVDQIITTGQNQVRAYDLRNGDLLWQCGGQTQRPVASPVAGHGLVFVGSGFRGSFLAAFDPTGRGRLDGTKHVVWSIDRNTPDLASLLLSDKRLYFTKGKTGLLSCVDATNGQPYYTTQRIDGVRTLYASPVAAGGHLYFTDRSGNIAVIKDGETFHQVGVNSMGQPIDATPAVVGDQMFIRGSRDLFCIDQPSS